MSLQLQNKKSENFDNVCKQYLFSRPVFRNIKSQSSTDSSYTATSRLTSIPEFKFRRPLEHLYGPDFEDDATFSDVNDNDNIFEVSQDAQFESNFVDIKWFLKILQRYMKYLLPVFIVILGLVIHHFCSFQSHIPKSTQVEKIKEENLKTELKSIEKLEFNHTIKMVEIWKKEMSLILQTIENKMSSVDFLSEKVSSLREELQKVKDALNKNLSKEKVELRDLKDDVNKHVNDFIHQVSQKKQRTEEETFWKNVEEKIMESNQNFLEHVKGKLKQLFDSFETKMIKYFRDEMDEKVADILKSSVEDLKFNDFIHSEEINSKILKAVKSFLRPMDELEFVDYAAKSQGGSIYNVTMTESSVLSIYILGLKLYSLRSSPEELIRTATDCWHFGGSSADVILQLSHKINVTMFSVEHALSRDLSSAPKQFAVYGLSDNFYSNKCEHELGTYTYDSYNIPIQKFDVKNSSNESFQLIRVSFLNNWGNDEITTVCRFKVHGIVSDEADRFK